MGEKQETIEFFENRCCVCYTPFFQKKRGRLRRTCSAACKQRLYKMRLREAAQADSEDPFTPGKVVISPYKRAKERHATICPACGEPIQQPERGRKRKTCSERCKKRLWRRHNPRCIVCGRTFKHVHHHPYQKYCSADCKNKANSAFVRKRQIEAFNEKHGIERPFWMPEEGSGYRIEVLMKRHAAQEAEIVYEREPDPNYLWSEPDPDEQTAQAAREEAQRKAAAEAHKKKAEEERRARELARRLLHDDW